MLKERAHSPGVSVHVAKDGPPKAPPKRGRSSLSRRSLSNEASTDKKERAVFVYYYVQLKEPFQSVERKLLDRLSGFREMAAAAYREGEDLRTRIGIVGTSRPLLAKTVRMSIGVPLRGDAETEIPITWSATGTPGLFPSMEAGIVIAALGPDLTQVALRGSYDPPLGSVGKALDRTLFHRVAEASVKSFVDRIASSIEREALEEMLAKL